MMHICFLSDEYPKPGVPHGGIGSFLKTIAPELVRLGHRVSVVGMNNTNVFQRDEDRGVTIYRLARRNVRGLTWWMNSAKINKMLRTIHNETPVDIVESAEHGLAFVAKLPSIKYIIRLHGGHHFFSEAENRPINAWKGFQEKRSFAKADAFIAVSEYVKSHTAKHLSYHGKPVRLINYPIDTEFFKPLNANLGQQDIVFAGTVCEKKGIRQLIQAFPMVKERFADATLQIYGRDWVFPDGSSYIEYLQKTEIVRLNTEVANSIHFHGAVNYAEIPVKYGAAAVCVFPSHMETQGLVAPEAMAMEKAVVFTNLGPGPETIAHYETGLLCDPHSPADIAQKICWVLDDRARAGKMGIRARAAVVKKYGTGEIVKKNLDLYHYMTNQQH